MALRLIGAFEVPVVDAAVEREVLKDLEISVKLALRDWLKAVSGRVPIWTGMARASLFAVAQLSGGHLLLSPLKGPSRIALGKSLGTATLETRGKEVIFTFSSDVLHYAIQENQNVGISKSAPWRSLKAGEEAFLVSLRKLLDEQLPKQISFKKRVVKF